MLKRENDQCNVIYTPEDDWFLLSFFLQLAELLESFGKQNQWILVLASHKHDLKINKLSTFRTI